MANILEQVIEEPDLKIGLINRQVIKSYALIKKYVPSVKPIEWILEGFIGGELKRYDQEKFAELAERKPHELTTINKVIHAALSFQYRYYGSLFAERINYLYGTNMNPEATGEIFEAGFFIANLIGAGISEETCKSYAGISINSVILNSFSYAKDLTKYIRKN